MEKGDPIRKNRPMEKGDVGRRQRHSARDPTGVSDVAGFADTYFLPTSYHMKKGKSRVYKAAILYCDALTKFIHVEPVALLVKDRPMSSVAVAGYKRFIAKCQELSEMEIHPTHLRTDGGAEWKGAFATFMTEQREIHPDAYAHTLTTGRRASSNSIAERSVASIQRLQYAHYRAVVRKWDEDKVATRNRRYD